MKHVYIDNRYPGDMTVDVHDSDSARLNRYEGVHSYEWLEWMLGELERKHGPLDVQYTVHAVS